MGHRPLTTHPRSKSHTVPLFTAIAILALAAAIAYYITTSDDSRTQPNPTTQTHTPQDLKAPESPPVYDTLTPLKSRNN